MFNTSLPLRTRPVNPAIVAGNYQPMETLPPITPIRATDDNHLSIQEKAALYGPHSRWTIEDIGDGMTPVLVEGFHTYRLDSARSGENYRIEYNRRTGKYCCECLGAKTHHSCWHIEWFYIDKQHEVMAARAVEWKKLSRIGDRPIETTADDVAATERESAASRVAKLHEAQELAISEYRACLATTSAYYKVPHKQRDATHTAGLDIAKVAEKAAYQNLANVRGALQKAQEALKNIDWRMSEVLRVKRSQKAPVLPTPRPVIDEDISSFGEI